MKKILFFLSLVISSVVLSNAQPIEPYNRTIGLQGSSCGSAILRIASSWPGSTCLPGYSITSSTVQTTFYLERSNDGTTGWTQVSGYGPVNGVLQHDFTVTQGGYYRGRFKIIYGASGGGGGCWNGSYTWEYLYTNVSGGVLYVNPVLTQPAVAYNINGSTSAFPTAINAFACNNIVLNNSSTGSVAEYRINVIRANADGSIPASVSPYQSNPSGTWTSGSIPATIDLKATTDIEVPGYYRVVLEARNSICTTSTKTAFVSVSGSPSAASTDFKMLVPLDVNATGKANRSTTRPGVQCGPSSVGIGDVANTTPDPTVLSNYQVIVAEVACSGAESPVTVASIPLTAAPGGSIPGSFNFSSALTPNGYFISNCFAAALAGKCYKVSLVATNPCAVSSTTYSYFHFPTTAAWFNCFKNNDGDASIDPLSTDEAVTTFPNPSTDMVTFSLKLANEGNVRIALFNLAGQKVWEYAGEQSKGVNEIKADLSQLPAAIYHYRVETSLQVHTGKVLKQ